MTLPANLKSVDPEQPFTAREAAEVLGVTPDTVKAYCRSRRLRGRQVGPKKAWVIRGAEIRQLLQEWNVE